MRYLFLLLLILPFLLEAQVEPKFRSRKKTELNSDVELRNLTEINTPALEFSPVFYGNGFVFVSSRRKEGPTDSHFGGIVVNATSHFVEKIDIYSSAGSSK